MLAAQLRACARQADPAGPKALPGTEAVASASMACRRSAEGMGSVSCRRWWYQGRAAGATQGGGTELSARMLERRHLVLAACVNQLRSALPSKEDANPKEPGGGSGGGRGGGAQPSPRPSYSEDSPLPLDEDGGLLFFFCFLRRCGVLPFLSFASLARFFFSCLPLSDFGWGSAG